MLSQFLSEESLIKHKEYLMNQKLKYSVLEKSTEALRGLSLGEVYRLRINKEEKKEAISLLADIKAHELYFSSFGRKYSDSKRIRECYGSIPSFLYRIISDAADYKYGFIFIYNERGKIKYCMSEHIESLLLSFEPILAVDLAEHSYFLDYGFYKDEYLKNALSHLDLSKCDA